MYFTTFYNHTLRWLANNGKHIFFGQIQTTQRWYHMVFFGFLGDSVEVIWGNLNKNRQMWHLETHRSLAHQGPTRAPPGDQFLHGERRRGGAEQSAGGLLCGSRRGAGDIRQCQAYIFFLHICVEKVSIYTCYMHILEYTIMYIYIYVCVIEREREKMYMHVYSNKHTYTHLLLFLSMVMGAVPGAESCHHLQTEVCRGRPGGHPESGQWRHGHSGFDARWRKQKQKLLG